MSDFFYFTKINIKYFLLTDSWALGQLCMKGVTWAIWILMRAPKERVTRCKENVEREGEVINNYFKLHMKENTMENHKKQHQISIILPESKLKFFYSKTLNGQVKTQKRKKKLFIETKTKILSFYKQ